MGFSWPVCTFPIGQYLFIVIVNIPNKVIKKKIEMPCCLRNQFYLKQLHAVSTHAHTLAVSTHAHTNLALIYIVEHGTGKG
jgi:hypothetical protein